MEGWFPTLKFQFQLLIPLASAQGWILVILLLISQIICPRVFPIKTYNPCHTEKKTLGRTVTHQVFFFIKYTISCCCKVSVMLNGLHVYDIFTDEKSKPAGLDRDSLSRYGVKQILKNCTGMLESNIFWYSICHEYFMKPSSL